MNDKVIVSLSGGMDSATVLAQAVASEKKVEAVGFTYGSKHNRFENEAARRIARHYKVPLVILDIGNVMGQIKSNLLEAGGPIPEGHYEAESMKQTVVPGRNLIFAAILAGIAQSRGGRDIWLGIHQGDHAIYPDCRPEFYDALRAVVVYSSEKAVDVYAPFIGMNKGGIVEVGLKLEVPYILTRTCYKNQLVACGKCGACQERLEAFRVNMMDDPIEYETRAILPTT